jgi:hypothetical protein
MSDDDREWTIWNGIHLKYLAFSHFIFYLLECVEYNRQNIYFLSSRPFMKYSLFAGTGYPSKQS